MFFQTYIDKIAEFLSSTPQKKHYADALIRNKEGKYLVALRSYQDDFEAGKWGLIGGKIDEGETPLKAIIREVKEETGLNITNAFELHKKKIKQGSITYFQVEWEGNLFLDNDEHFNYKWVTEKELLELDLIIGLKETFPEVASKQSYGCLMLKLNIDDNIWGDFVLELTKEVKSDVQEIEFEPHITVLYGVDLSTPPEQVKELIQQFVNKPIEVRLSGVSLFENEKYDVVKFDVESEDLIALNEFVKSKLNYTNSFVKYHPHATICYMNVGKGKQFVNKDIKLTFSCDEFIYSGENDDNLSFKVGENNIYTHKDLFKAELIQSIELLEKAYDNGQIEEDSLLDALEKAFKYIKREPDGKGGWNYTYLDEFGTSKKPSEKEIISTTTTGMDIQQYSDKSILISGDTYTNVETMRSIKKEIGVGSYNAKLKGWVFPSKFIDTVLGLLWSDLKNKGEDDKAQAVANKKNESLEKGSEIELSGLQGKVTEGVSNETGVKYNIELTDGTKLTEVDERVLDVKPTLNDTKLAELNNKSEPENRAKIEKKIYGLKPIEDIYNYSLEEYMVLHGLEQADIDKYISRMNNKKESPSEPKKTTSYSKPKDKKEQQGLTKQQLISKLVYNHYQSVKKAIEEGKTLSDKALVFYPDLKEAYSKKREAMSEETKRKISEALKKNLPEELEKEINDKPVEEIKPIEESFSNLDTELIRGYSEKLANYLEEQSNIKAELEELRIRERTEPYSRSIWDKKSTLAERRNELDKLIMNQENIISVLKSGGSIDSIEDKKGGIVNEAPNYTKINTQNIYFNQESILTDEKPSFIPNISQDYIRGRGFILDAIKVDDDKYIVALNGHEEKSFGEGKNPSKNGYAIMTLDQVVLTTDYYVKKQKALYQEQADRKNQRQLDSWNNSPDSRKEYYLMQKNSYFGLPAKDKKKITQAEWEALTWQEREKIYIPVKKYGAEKIKTNIEDSKMHGSFHYMFERYVNPEAKMPEPRTAHREAWKSWSDFREVLDWKRRDIEVQRDDYSGTFEKGFETSFGESNTDAVLKEQYGILVKRQNGDGINSSEIKQIEEAWVGVEKTFGKMKELAIENNLKLSHSGSKLMFARKAVGIYIPRLQTIGVSAKYGTDQLGFTLAHEVAHWVDNSLGKQQGKRFASDNFDSKAGKVAIAMRKGMNQVSNSNYYNCTHECFARALEQYHAVESYGEDAMVFESEPYFANANYVSKEYYNSTLKPLIEDFLNENKEFFKSNYLNDFFNIEDIDIIKGDVADEEYTTNGTIKPSTRKGKKAMVYMDGSWYHFGDAKMKHNYSKEARESATARHKKNLEGSDSRAKAFRVYWRKYWSEGGKVKKTDERVEKSDIEQALDTLSKAFDMGKISEEQYLESLEKARKYQIGEISQTTGLKKVKEGVWVDPNTGKQVKSDEDGKSKESKVDDFKERVKHSQFGDGTVIGRSDGKITILFDDDKVGEKTFIEKYVSLKKISNEKQLSKEELIEFAKNTSLVDLERQIKESSDPELRLVASNEIRRRKEAEYEVNLDKFDFSFSKKDYMRAYESIMDSKSDDIKDDLDKYISELTGEKTERVASSKYYYTDKKINGKEVVFRVSDHVHSQKYIDGSESFGDRFIVSLVIDPKSESFENGVRTEYAPKFNYIQISIKPTTKKLDSIIPDIEEALEDISSEAKFFDEN